jgi:hypothetical protein
VLDLVVGKDAVADEFAQINRGVEHLLAQIKQIAPQTWEGAGGSGIADFYPLGTSLVVKQSHKVQEAIAELLAARRRALDNVASCPGPCPAPVAVPPAPLPPPQAADFVPFTVFVPRVPPAAPVPGMPMMPGNVPLYYEPVPAPCEVGESSGPSYLVQTKLVSVGSDGRKHVRRGPVTGIVAAGEDIGDAFAIRSDERGLLHCGNPESAHRHAQRLCHLQIKVADTHEGMVDLETQSQRGIDKSITRCRIAMKIGKTAKIPLDRDDSGAPQSWLEVRIQRAGNDLVAPPPVVQGIPYPVCPPCPNCPMTIFPPPMPTGPIYPNPMMALPHPMPAPPCPPAAPALVQCGVVEVSPPPPPTPAATHAGESHPWLLRAECAGCEMKLTGLQMQLPGCGVFRMATAHKQIQVQGPFLTASADCVAGTDKPGCFLLEGHVRLHYEKEGRKLEVTADRITVNVTDGRMEIQPAAGAPIHVSQLLDSCGSGF